LLLRVLYFSIGLIVAVLVAYVLILWGTGGDYITQPHISHIARDPLSVARAGVAQALAREPGDKQILFGDLHVHTTWSSDAFPGRGGISPVSG
jgi:hypothetical protein